MKKIRTIMLLLCCLCVLKSMAQSQTPTDFKIISYNILEGFNGRPQSRASFIRWVKEQQPDVLALEELVGFTEKKLYELAAEYGHPYVAIVKERGYPVGITSRKPIQVVNKFVEGYWHGVLHVRTYGLDLIVTHLSPHEWTFRLKEARQITSYIRSSLLKNYMVMGDLNAFSPHDADEVETHAQLIERMIRWDQEHPQQGNMRGNRFDYSVLSEFLSIGMRDVIQMYVPAAKRMSFPTVSKNYPNRNDPAIRQGQQRLDYILVSENLVPNCKNSFVHNGAENDGISDHYPVSLIMQLPE